MDDVRVHVKVDGVERARETLDGLEEKLAEAKSLVAELASALERLGLHRDV